uniref:Potassium calcium-activated channel subfamily M regulatory beta subunit 4 n=1 Tax=Equus caballus TaxID=9796 RepID=H9GZX9_HORSE
MAKLRVAYEYTEAEDKSLRLGLFLIVSGVVSLFIFGFCWLGPALQGLRATAANCTVLSVQQLREEFECTFTCGSACSGTAHYPCVQVFVRGPEASSRALLHPDERQLLANPKCSYIPPCKRENQKNLESVMNWQQYWEEEIGSQPFTCYFNQFQSAWRSQPDSWGVDVDAACRQEELLGAVAVFHLQSTRALRFPPASPLQPRLHPHALCRAVLNYTWCPEYLPNGTCALSRASPASTACEDFPEAAFSGRLSLTSRPDDVLLHRTHDEIVLLHCFLWPLVTFVVGVLIVVLTICAKSLAVKAEAMKKRKSS